MQLIFSTSSVGMFLVYSWLRQVLLRVSFGIKVVFPLVIHSVISVFCMQLFISVASLSCMEVYCLNQNPCIPSRPEVFHFGIFLRVALCPSDLLRAFATLFPCCLSIRLFYYDLSVPIFCFKIFLPLLHTVVDMSSLTLPLIVGRICFGTSCFVHTAWLCLGIFLAFLLLLEFLLVSSSFFWVLVAVLFPLCPII